MSEAADLYETDFALWAETQARVLRDASAAGVNVPVDWANVAEEIESLARTDRRTLRSHLVTIIEHLLKLKYSAAEEPRAGWRKTVRRARQEVELVVDDSPSLRRELSSMIVACRDKAADNAVQSLMDHGEQEASLSVKLLGAAYEPDLVLDEQNFEDRRTQNQ